MVSCAPDPVDPGDLGDESEDGATWGAWIPLCFGVHKTWTREGLWRTLRDGPRSDARRLHVAGRWDGSMWSYSDDYNDHPEN